MCHFSMTSELYGRIQGLSGDRKKKSSRFFHVLQSGLQVLRQWISRLKNSTSSSWQLWSTSVAYWSKYQSNFFTPKNKMNQTLFCFLGTISMSDACRMHTPRCASETSVCLFCAGTISESDAYRMHTPRRASEMSLGVSISVTPTAQYGESART